MPRRMRQVTYQGPPANLPMQPRSTLIMSGYGVTNLKGLGDPFVYNDGTQWRMLYAAGNTSDITTNVYEATLPAGTNLNAAGSAWTFSSTPLVAHVAAAYDTSAIETPSYVKVGAVERIYYVGASTGGVPGTDPFVISYMEKIAGTWTRHGSAVLTGAAAWELWTGISFVSEPSVVYDGTTYHMWYTGGSSRSVGYVNSTDGITWTNKNQLYSSGLVWSPVVRQVHNHYEISLASVFLDGAPTSGLNRAKQVSGAFTGQTTDWGTFQPYVAACTQGEEWHYNYIYGATPVYDPVLGQQFVFYTGRDDANTSNKPHLGRIQLALME